MNESVRITIGVLLAGYVLWWCFRIYVLNTNRSKKPTISAGGISLAALALAANVVIFKLVMGCPWRIALIFGLVVALFAIALAVVRYLYYQRSR